ncbi:aldo/keto reductase [Acidobacteriota bacterium]
MKKAERQIDRRRFIRTGLTGLTGAALTPTLLKASSGDKSPSIQEKDGFIYRKFGKTGLTLPIVSMGVMNADNPNLVAGALDSGIVHLDTAHGYQKGRNEEMIGEVIKNRKRDSLVLSTKVAYSKDRQTGLYPEGTTIDTFQNEFDISLKRLGVDYVDIIYIHSFWVRDVVLFEPAMKFLERAKKQGKARFIGFTTHRNEHEMLDAAVESKFYEVVLTGYNFRQKNHKEIAAAMARASQAGIGIVAMKTQAGVFWDKERKEPINMKASLKWALNNKHVHTAIPGFTTFDQMNLDIGVMEDLTLTAQEKTDLRLDGEQAGSGLYCQQCETCLTQCPADLDIPTLMRSYMYAYGYRNQSLARETLDSMKIANLPCEDCSRCRVECSMGFDIQEKAKDINRLKSVPTEFLG